MVDLGILKDQPNNSIIKEKLNELEIDNIDVNSSLILLKYVFPIYPSLTSSNKESLRRIFSKSFLLFVQLLNFSKALYSFKEVIIYKDFIIEMLKKEKFCIHNFLSLNESVNISLFKSIFFGSTLFNLLSDKLDAFEYLNIMKIQLSYWFNHNKKWENRNYANIILSLFQFNNILTYDIIIGGLILTSESYWRCFEMIYRSGTPIIQKRLINYLLTYLNKICNEKNVNEVYKLINVIGTTHIDLYQLLKGKNTLLNCVIINLLSSNNKVEFCRILLYQFENYNLDDDYSICELFTMVLNNLSNDDKSMLVHDEKFLNAVTSRLSSEYSEIRERTMFIAKNITNGKLKYEHDYEILVPDLKIDLNEIKKINFSLLTEINESSQQIINVLDNVKNLKITHNIDKQDDNDYKDIIFLKDLLLNYNTFQNSDKSYSDIFKKTINLVRQKSSFTFEVSYYAESLLSEVATANNSMDEENFEELRINALVSILVVVPEKVADLMRILFNADLSLQQRMSILTTFSLSARELRGIDDKIIYKPKKEFPTRKLPWDKSKENNTAELLNDVSTDIKDGKLIWKSTKLSKQTIKQQDNKFRKYASQFFYPLAHGWLNGIDMGTFDKLFKTHYFNTLKIIISIVHPHSQYEEMNDLMSQITEDAINQGISIS